MSVYDGAASTALALISAKGGAMPLRRVAITVTDPVSQASTEATQAATFRAVGLPPGKSAEFVLGSLQNRNIVEMHVALKWQALTPRNGDIITWAGADWRVIWVYALDPADDLPVYAKLYAER